MYDINWIFDLKILCVGIYLFFEKIYGLDYILYNVSSRLYV